MKMRLLLIAALTFASLVTISACGIVAPSKCTAGHACIVTVAGTNDQGMPVLQGSNAPTYPPYPPAPVSAERTCDSLGGDWYRWDYAYWQDSRWNKLYICENIPYIGNDGGSYEFGNIDITYDRLVITEDPQVPSANYQECVSGNYPAGSPGSPGHWDSAYQFCMP